MPPPPPPLPPVPVWADELRAAFAEVFRTRTMAEWAQVFDGTDACVTPVLSLAEAAQHPHNVARGSFISVNGVEQMPLEVLRYRVVTDTITPVEFDDVFNTFDARMPLVEQQVAPAGAARDADGPREVLPVGSPRDQAQEAAAGDRGREASPESLAPRSGQRRLVPRKRSPAGAEGRRPARRDTRRSAGCS